MRESVDLQSVPTITIDGLSGTGKGTIAALVAQKLGWHVLDSGAIYRAAAWAIARHNLDLTDEQGLVALLSGVKIEVRPATADASAYVGCDGHDITNEIRSERCGMFASQASSMPVVRQSLLHCQQACRRLPGLVADGRDMGTVVFPDADLKVFLTASEDERVKRRFKQLQDSGNSVSLGRVRGDLRFRDEQDAGRSIAPAKPADDAVIVDTTNLSIDQVARKVMYYARNSVLS